LLPLKDAVPQLIGEDPAVLDGVHVLCLKHGTYRMRQALDWLEMSKDPGHRLVAAGFRRKLDVVTAVTGFNGDK
jgi:hypothetical protein